MDKKIKQEEIIQDLKDSGFGAEMKTIRTFLQRGWACTGGIRYFDHDAQETQEIAFIAHTSRHPKRITSRLYVVGEVIKAPSPWIIFKSKPPLTIDAWNNLIFSDNIPLPNEGDRLVNEMTSRSLLARCQWKGYGVHESFGKRDQPPGWYSAFVGSCKAGEEILKSETWKEGRVGNGIERWNSEKLVCFTMIKPVVILDSTLFSAEMLDNGEIEVTEINAAPVAFEYRSTHYKRESGYIVDVVRLSALEDYINESELRHADIVEAIQAMVAVAPRT